MLQDFKFEEYGASRQCCSHGFHVVDRFGMPIYTKRSLAVSSSAAGACTNFDEKVGVLLFNLGGPETLNDVQQFLFNLFADSVSDRAI